MNKLMMMVALALCSAAVFSQEANLIEPGLVFSNREQLIQHYGEPLRLIESEEGTVNLYYREFKIWLREDKARAAITAIVQVFYSPAWKLPNGLTVGSSRLEILRVMGQPDSSEPYRLRYRQGQGIIAFNLNGEQQINLIVLE